MTAGYHSRHQSGTSMHARALCWRRRASTLGTSLKGGNAQFNSGRCVSPLQSCTNAFGGCNAPGSTSSEQNRVSKAFALDANRSHVNASGDTLHCMRSHSHGETLHPSRSASDNALGTIGRDNPSTPTRIIVSRLSGVRMALLRIPHNKDIWAVITTGGGCSSNTPTHTTAV